MYLVNNLKRRIPVLLLITAVLFQIEEKCFAQTHAKLSGNYEKYKEASITHRRFKHQDIVPLIENLKDQFNVQKVGASVEGRSIYMVSYGTGEQSVLLWSQMHGNESTATMALMDIFNFLGGNDEHNELRKLLRENLTIHFIPMLNPDGAERFQRRNVYGFDINRDALRLQSPEARALKKVRDSLEADWGFNLHDQSRYNASGLSPKTATLSFLAPAYNYEKDINEKRGDAIKLIGVINNIIQKYIPGKVGKYPDDFEPRAFGDNIQKWGTRTILVESGGLVDDREKQEIRKLNFVLLLSAMESIATGSYQDYSLEVYNNLPFNRSGRLHDLLIRNVKLDYQEDKYITDVAFRNNEIEDEQHKKYYLKSRISDLGDLSTYYGYEEFDATGFEVEFGKVYPTKFENYAAIKALDIKKLLQEGYTDIVVDEIGSDDAYSNLPLKIHSSSPESSGTVSLGSNPSLVFLKDGSPLFVVINGVLYDLMEDFE